MTAEPAIERTEVPDNGPVAALARHVAEGHVLLVQVKGGPLVRVTPVAPDQEWFWSTEWQAKEAEVEADRAAGKQPTFYASDEEFLAALDAAVEDPAAL
jgi:hypothetical protein